MMFAVFDFYSEICIATVLKNYILDTYHSSESDEHLLDPLNDNLNHSIDELYKLNRGPGNSFQWTLIPFIFTLELLSEDW